MRLVLDARARALLGRLPRTNPYALSELILLAVLAVQCARLTWALLTPLTPLGPWVPAAPGVAGSPALQLKQFDPFFRLSGGDGSDKPGVVTSLQLTLFGTRRNEAMGGGSAIIAGPDGVQQSIGVGQEIIPGVTLKAVAFDHVTISRNGADEQLFLAQDASTTPAPPTDTTPIAGSLLKAPPPPPRSGTPVSQLRTDIGFIPRIDNGRISGLAVRSQGSGTAFRAAGLQDGDVVTAIGGRPVTGASDIERLGAQFPTGGILPITVERGNQTLPLSITIAAP
ncbi:MAG: type II secretory protein PulC [Pseudomonadota bacterium]|nr:type II secretory protein PulC [Pseudomonadota bacterium]